MTLLTVPAMILSSPPCGRVPYPAGGDGRLSTPYGTAPAALTERGNKNARRAQAERYIRPLVDAVGDRVCRARAKRGYKAHAYPHVAASDAWEPAAARLH